MTEHAPTGHDLNVVSLRDYTERLFSEHQKAIDIAFGNQKTALEAARSHIEAIFNEHRMAHNQKHLDDERALEQARAAIDLRLEKLNELRSEVIQDRGEYVRQDVFDTKIAPLLEFRSRALGAAAVLAIISGAIGAAVVKVLGG